MSQLFDLFMNYHRAQEAFVAALTENGELAASKFSGVIAEWSATAGQTGKTPKKVKAPKAEKKERDNAGQPTCWATFCKVKREENKDAYDTWLAERLAAAKAGQLFYMATDPSVKDGRAVAGEAISEKKAKQAAHIVWVSLQYRGEDQSEWKAFEAAWKETHPKGSRAASVAESVSADEDAASQAEKPVKKRGPKKMADMTPDELAAAKAKRAAKKAEKDAIKASSEADERESYNVEPASPVAQQTPSAAIGGAASPAAPAAPATEADGTITFSMLPFINKKVKYVRFGHRDENGVPEWDEGNDIWLQNANGTKGAYAGKLLSNGQIDNSPQTMDDEPEME